MGLSRVIETKEKSGGSAKLKVLLSAYACEPDRGSEPGVGWNVALKMAEHCEVTVITKVNNEEVITEALKNYEGPKPKFIYYDLPAWVIWIKKTFSCVALYYFLWQIGVRLSLRKQLPEFDVIHHVTFNGFQLPGFWLGVEPAVVLGPLGGGMTYPSQFLKTMPVGKVKERFRNFAVKAFYYNPITRWTLRSADCVLAANRETADLLEGMTGKPVEVMLETAYQADEVSEAEPRTRSDGASLRVLWAGGLMARKAPQLAIEAVRQARENGAAVVLDFIGSGPLLSSLEDGLEDSDQEWLTFHGQIPHRDIDSYFEAADIFLFTSLRDTSGNVVLEAMAHSLPVIAPDHQGVAEICSPEHAILVPVKNPKQLTSGFADAILFFCDNQQLMKKKGVSSRERLRKHWTWGSYGSKMAKIYQQLSDS